MADITITATSVLTSGTKQQGTLGETVTAGQAVYKKSSDSKWYKAQADGTAEENGSNGIAIAMTGGATGQGFLYVDKAGVTVTIGGTVAAGTEYYVSATAGGICPFADLVSTNRVCRIGYADSTSTIVTDFKYMGEVLA